MSPGRMRPSGVRLLLLRHGETGWNAAGRYQGSTNTPLSPRGRAQARAAAHALRDESLDRVLSSPLRRAWETAQAVRDGRASAGGLSAPSIEPEPRIAEICFGQWEGLTHAEIARSQPEALHAWQVDPLSCAPPGGETLTAVANRVGHLLDELRGDAIGQSLLLVGHGGSLSILLCLALGLSPDRRWQLGMSHAALSELHLYPEGAILVRHNDTHHLCTLDEPSPMPSEREGKRTSSLSPAGREGSSGG